MQRIGNVALGNSHFFLVVVMAVRAYSIHVARGNEFRRNVKEAIKLAIVARKGGVGRTPICQNLAGACADRHAKILLIDQDPQGSLSKNFFGKEHVNRLGPGQTAATIYSGGHQLQSVIHETAISGVFIVPANDHMQEFDYFPAQKKDRKVFALRKFMSQVEQDFSMILIDTPPNAGNLPVAATWAACDYSLTVIQPTKNAIEAIADIKTRIAAVMASTNPGLSDLGCLLTNVKNTKVHRSYVRAVRQLYGENIFKTVIPTRTVFEEAIAARMPVTHYRPKSDIAETFRQALREIGQKINEAHKVVQDKVANE